MTIPVGIYRHYKGPLYLVLGVARHHETGDLEVIYHPIEPHGNDREPMWNRRNLNEFLGYVAGPHEGTVTPRFHFLYAINNTGLEHL